MPTAANNYSAQNHELPIYKVLILLKSITNMQCIIIGDNMDLPFVDLFIYMVTKKL